MYIQLIIQNDLYFYYSYYISIFLNYYHYYYMENKIENHMNKYLCLLVLEEVILL